ncbi:NAD(P)H-hydrate dehydratase [Jeongeupia sp. USM3]|uniref:NAD(P)H-hydrate dehydratase n=1 Tax=Jeongeupia sp. USM3 TaxID=1906741 RepID=UPI00089DE0B1|nr:NAD(P)H-hydrate dehydratase [Jeongeupia sp. USM3]AOY00621.1 NAD(P)H-hydrate dehydratase [Jeongeupia sp. USM3]
MTPLYLSGTLRRLEQTHAQHRPPLIELAGRAIADWLLAQYRGRRFGLLAGPGNNGADALHCAGHLRDAGQTVCIWMPYGPDAGPAPPAGLADCDVIVDGLFGLGLSRDLAPDLVAGLRAIDALGKVIVAIDAPSGLDADRGVARPYALHADHTLAMLARKPGYYTADGRDHCGKVHLLELLPGIAPAADAVLVDAPPSQPSLRRRHASHKGSHGTLAIVGGAAGMAGAALLAGRMAARAGAGKVFVGLLDPALSVDPLQPELMLRPAGELLSQAVDVVAVGPGLGQSRDAAALLAALLDADLPLVLDADALNLIAASGPLQGKLRGRGAPSLITPHPAEAARLLGVTTAEVQRDRLEAAHRLVVQLGCTVLLKGSGTVCADGESTSINASGNGALGAAGQGDLLAGLIAALWVQGLAPIAAARLGAYVHGRAADEWRERHPNGLGLCASELIAPIRALLNGI